jgi:molybdopterin/thiamine biosynthesis adenylyltransferase
VSESNEKHEKQVVLIGCGGNVGSHVVDHLGRLDNVGRVTLVDPDRYESKNLRTQNIVPADVGRPKATVQADRLHRVNPHLDIRAFVDSVENVPLGCLNGDVILAAVDSKRARQVINEIARRLDLPWLDSGVEGERLFARVTVYFPGREEACLECRWASEYEDLETSYPCTPDGTPDSDATPSGKAPATNAPSSLGALAASLLVIECRKVLAGESRYEGGGYEVFMEADYHNLYPTRLQVNPECRVQEHRSGSIKPLSGFETRSIDSTLGELLRSEITTGESEATDDDAPRLRVVGQRFITNLTCEDCGHRRSYVKLRVSLKSDGSYKCDRCGGEMIATGFDTTDELDGARLSTPTAGRTLRSVGIRDGDVVCVSRRHGQPRYVVTLNGSHRRRARTAG